MDQDLRWLVGIAVSMAVFVGGALMAAFRNLAARISKSSGELHKRVDEVKDNYVRRDDLEAHISRLEDSIRDMRHEVRDSNTQVLEAIRSNPR